MRGSSSRGLSRLIAAVAWIFTTERLDTEEAAAARAAPGPGDGAKSSGGFLRTLVAHEALPPAAAPVARAPHDHGPGRLVHWLIGRESLPTESPPADAARAVPRQPWLRRLSAREPLALDAAPDTIAVAPRGVSLGWLLRRERLGPLPPPIGPHENPPSLPR